MSSGAKRIFVGTDGSDRRWRGRLVEVLVRPNGPGPRNALVEFDTGERVVVPTYSGGVGATLRVPRVPPTMGRPAATRN